MSIDIRCLICVACVLVFALQPCLGVELVVSDSGRNTAWSLDFKQGDSFSVTGADGEPVGGILAGTQFLEQCLVPMPSKIELQQMSQAQEQVWVQNLAELLKDRVHIATTNGTTIFEIRLLQDTPMLSTTTLSWQDNPYTDRFARMTYQAIGGLVSHLQERKEPVRMTAALADSGVSAFARSIDNWKPYAATFRRVDLVDGRASLTEISPVLSTLGGKRVRLFYTAGAPTAPAMSIGRKEVAETLLQSHRYLTQYTLTSTEPKGGATDQAGTSWMTSLAGFDAYTVKRRQHVNGETVEQTLARDVIGQDFRDPIAGWDPVNLNLHATDSLEQLGVMATISHQTVVPTLHRSLATGYRFTQGYSHGSPSDIPAFFAITSGTQNPTQLNEQINHLADVASDFKNVLVVGDPDLPLTRQLAGTISMRLGANRVKIINDPSDSRELHNLAQEYNASCLVGYRKQFETTYKNASFLITRDTANTLVKGASALKDSLEALRDYHAPAKGEQWTFDQFLKSKKYSGHLGEHKWLSPTLRTVERATGLLESLNKDFALSDQGQFRWITSHTVEKVGEIGMEVMTDSEFLIKAIGETSALYRPLAAFGSGGGVDAVRAIARITGSRNWNPKKWDVKTWELVTDSFSDATAYGLGWVYANSIGASHASHEIGSAFQSSAALVRGGLRSSTQPLFSQFYRGKGIAAIAQYQSSVDRALFYGAKIPQVDDHFPKDMIKSLAISENLIAELREYQSDAEWTQSMNRNVSSTPSSRTTEDARLHDLADYAKVKSETFQMSSTNFPKYNPSSKKAQPGDIWVRSGPLVTMPHGGNYWGPQNQGNFHFDSIELAKDSTDKTFIVPKHFTADEGPTMNFYRPLESDIDCVYQGRKMKLKDLSTPVKERIRSSAFRHDFSMLGSSLGEYRVAGLRQSSNQCIDSLLAPWEKALSDTGVDILDKEGNSARLIDHFRVGKTANPMSWPSIPRLGIGALGAVMKKVEPPYFTRTHFITS